jgi:hypothetical protein
MAGHPDYNEEVMGVWLFNNDLEDEIAGNDFAEDAGDVSQYTQYQQYNLVTDAIQTNYGLTFSADNSYTSSGSSISLVAGTSDGFTVSFWYYSPGLVGFTRHSVTNKLQPKLAPIIGKGNISGSSTSGFQESDAAVFMIGEVGYSTSQNAIQVDLCQNQAIGAGTPTGRFVSDPFTPGFHHIFVSFHEASGYGQLRIDVDGKFGKIFWFSFTPSGTSTAPIRLNKLYHGHTAHEKKQVGAYISDLVIRDDGGDDSDKAYRFGWEAISKSDKFYDLYSIFGVSYQQPSTISTNQIWAEGGNIYVARSNGEILKGMRPIWDTEEDYSENAQQGLELEGGTVRI